MTAANVCWGIEVGAGSIKAIKLERDGEGARVADYAVIPHPKPLSTPDLDQAEALRVGLGTFVGQSSPKGGAVAVSVPGHMGFTRFAKLPPVDPKKVPDIVKFEAVQQIPFPIEQVEWDYQTFVSEDSPDVEVGIFAITRERVMERMSLLADVGLASDVVTLSPVAVYNALAFDLHFTENTPGTVILDIGTVSTDLIVAEAGRLWIRTFPIGGHHFTDCLVNAFKLTYAKAEKLKREIEQSPHKRQVFQAMRSVFEDLATDIQRSLQYYQQLHPEAKLTRLVGLGATMQLPGLKKFLEQRLSLDVIRLEQFQRIGIEGAQAAEFQAAAHQLCTAYGCALQGLGLTPIAANLVPVTVVRESMWKRKTPWFAAAAALSVLAGGAAFVRPMMDRRAVPQSKADAARAVRSVVDQGNRLKQAWTDAAKETGKIGHSIANYTGLFEHRGVTAQVLDDVGQMLASAQPQPELFTGGSVSIPPGEWRVFDLKRFAMDAPGAPTSVDGVDGAKPVGSPFGSSGPAAGAGAQQAAAPPPPPPAGGGPGGPGAEAGPQGPTATLTMIVESPNAGQIRFVNESIVKWLEANKQRPGVPYRIIPPDPTKIPREKVGSKPGAAAEAASATGGGGGSAAAPTGGAGRQPSGGLAPGGASAAAAAPAAAAAATHSGGTGIDALAPMPATPTVFPAGADVYRYVITWKIEMLPPGLSADAGHAAGAPAGKGAAR